MRWILADLKAYGWAVLWRLGFHRPRSVGSYVRYVGPTGSDPWLEMTSERVRRRLQSICRIAALRVIEERQYLHPIANPDSEDPYDHIGSIGWKFIVEDRRHK